MTCKTCNHRKVSEGGWYLPNVKIDGENTFPAITPHPCHENPTRPCYGHLRDLKQVGEGLSKYNGDVITYSGE